ncbi:vWA domain-containing protein [Brevundimonas sp.]
MLATMLKQGVAAVLGLSLAAPSGGAGVVQTRPAYAPGDGAVSPAACEAVGISLRDRRVQERAYAAPTMAYAAPPPITLPIEPTKKEDRVEYTGPAIVVPGPPPPPPPPPAPPAPMRPPVIGMTVTGQRTVDGVIATPAPVNTERYPDATPNPVRRVADEPVSTFSIDVDTASYANVRRFISDGEAPPRDAVRVEEMINYFDYGYARPTSASEPFAVSTVVTPSPWSEGRQIVHIGLQGYELPAGERRPLNLTFMVDVSGSMTIDGKLELAKRSMNLIIDRLRPEDRVAVTYYAGSVGTAIASTSGTDKLKLRCAVEALDAGGGTAGAAGLVNAYDQAEAAFGRDKVNRILMFTDGDFNVGVTEDKRLEDYVAEKRGTGIYLSVYGYGRGNYQDARMQTIAQAGNGIAAYVDDLGEARRLFGPAFDRGAFPIADDVKIQVEFNPARVSEYRLIGYETRLLNEEDFSNDAVDAGEVGSGASVTALYEITPVGGPGQIPERRYEGNRPTTGGGDPNGELGFVQVRYKLPGQPTSRMMQQAVSDGGAGAAPEATRWAMAVAGFGQRLRGDPWMSADFDNAAVMALAQGARGEDPYGERAAFVQMVRAVDGLPARGTP